jgi:hypothetical protein
MYRPPKCKEKTHNKREKRNNTLNIKYFVMLGHVAWQTVAGLSEGMLLPTSSSGSP